MNNLQLIAWAIRRGKLVIHNPSPRCRFYTCAMPHASVSHESLPIALDMACEQLRGEALVASPRMA
jgi:hypothetical protein